MWGVECADGSLIDAVPESRLNTVKHMGDSE